MGDDAAGDLGDQRRGAGGGVQAPLGVAAALEAVAGVGVEAEAAARGAHPPAVEVGALDEQVGGRVGDLAVGAAHDAGQRHRPLGVGDDQHLGVEGARDAVEGRQPLAAAGAADDDAAAGEAGEVEGVERLAQLPEDVVGDVHDVVDRALADRLEPPAQPRRARPDGDAAHDARGVARAPLGVFELERRQLRDRLRRLLGRRRWPPQRLVERHRHLARQAEVAHAVHPVGGDVDVEEEVAVAGRELFDGQSRAGQPPRQLARPLLAGGDLDVLREPLAREEHQARTCLRRRSSFSNSTRMLGMP